MAKRRNMKRRTHRKGTRKSRMRGGYVLTGSNINDTSMNASYKLNMLQGQQYGSEHANQHGGVANVGDTGVLPENMRAASRMGQMGGMAPVGDTGVMDVNRVEARLVPLDASFQEIAGMKDQGGGGRRRSRKSRKGSRKSRKGSRKSRSGKKSRRCWTRRNMGGGKRSTMSGGKRSTMSGGVASINDPTLLLPVDMEKQAVMGMNAEWKLAENPTSFDPIKH